MTALEAKALALAKNNEVLKTVFEIIKDAALSGKTEVNLNSYLLSETQVKQLQSLGYNVQQNKINW